MGCCGQTRKELNLGTENLINPDTLVPNGSVRVAYLGNNSFTLRGTYTGTPYSFSPTNRVLTVDERDGRVILRTRYFRRVR